LIEKGEDMDEIKVEVLNVFEHFEYKSEFNQSTNGLYEIKMNGDKAMIFRNGDSWGVLSHWLGEPVTKCINFMRGDRVEVIENAIKKNLELNK